MGEFATVLGKEIYFDRFLLRDLKIVKDKVLKQNNLFIAVVDGRPGSGKSTMVAQAAAYLDPNFNLKKECFNTKQFEEALRNAKPGDSIVLDESFDSMNRRRSQSLENMRILSLLQTLRCKRVFIFLIVPSVYDLDKSVLLGLTTLFIHCYRPGGVYGPRGFFAVYDDIGLKRLYIYCRQALRYSLKVAKPIYRGRFSKAFPLDYDVYESKKNKSAFEQSEGAKEDSVVIQRTQRDKAIIELTNKGMKVKEIANLLELDSRSIYYVLRKNKSEA